MSGSASPLSQNNKWVATVVIKVHDEFHNPVANVMVSGNWTDPGIGSGGAADSCVTNASGTCSVLSREINKNITSTTFSINTDGLSHASYSYQRSANHDPGGCETPSCDAIIVFQLSAAVLNSSNLLMTYQETINQLISFNWMSLFYFPLLYGMFFLIILIRRFL
ncbi:MAG: hypothetical protein OEV06_01990 [Anaerolineae bacterium]|nr:hypothetical protein [Anaerolineae bacterium]